MISSCLLIESDAGEAHLNSISHITRRAGCHARGVSMTLIASEECVVRGTAFAQQSCDDDGISAFSHPHHCMPTYNLRLCLDLIYVW